MPMSIPPCPSCWGCQAALYHFYHISRNNSCPEAVRHMRIPAHAAPIIRSCEFDDRYFDFPSRVMRLLTTFAVYHNTPGWKSSPTNTKNGINIIGAKRRQRFSFSAISRIRQGMIRWLKEYLRDKNKGGCLSLRRPTKPSATMTAMHKRRLPGAVAFLSTTTENNPGLSGNPMCRKKLDPTSYHPLMTKDCMRTDGPFVYSLFSEIAFPSLLFVPKMRLPASPRPGRIAAVFIRNGHRGRLHNLGNGMFTVRHCTPSKADQTNERCFDSPLLEQCNRC